MPEFVKLIILKLRFYINMLIITTSTSGSLNFTAKHRPTAWGVGLISLRKGTDHVQLKSKTWLGRWYSIVHLGLNGSQLAKMKKSIPDMSLP